MNWGFIHFSTRNVKPARAGRLMAKVSHLRHRLLGAACLAVIPLRASIGDAVALATAAVPSDLAFRIRRGRRRAGAAARRGRLAISPTEMFLLVGVFGV